MTSLQFGALGDARPLKTLLSVDAAAGGRDSLHAGSNTCEYSVRENRTMMDERKQ